MFLLDLFQSCLSLTQAPPKVFSEHRTSNKHLPGVTPGQKYDYVMMITINETKQDIYSRNVNIRPKVVYV